MGWCAYRFGNVWHGKVMHTGLVMYGIDAGLVMNGKVMCTGFAMHAMVVHTGFVMSMAWQCTHV